MQVLMLACCVGAERSGQTSGTISRHSALAPAKDEPLSKGLLSSNIIQLESEKGELEQLLQSKLLALVEARKQRANLSIELSTVASDLTDLQKQKRLFNKKVQWVRAVLLNITARYEAEVNAATVALTCLQGTCQEAQLNIWGGQHGVPVNLTADILDNAVRPYLIGRGDGTTTSVPTVVLDELGSPDLGVLPRAASTTPGDAPLEAQLVADELALQHSTQRRTTSERPTATTEAAMQPMSSPSSTKDRFPTSTTTSPRGKSMQVRVDDHKVAEVKNLPGNNTPIKVVVTLGTSDGHQMPAVNIKVKSADEPRGFDGKWVHLVLNKESTEEIKGNLITWSNGNKTPLVSRNTTEIALELHDRVYTGRLEEDKRIVWDDEDIWTRVPEKL
eukprot:CAMPEP_0171092740 /NCGR_PEP_ID=MMETSP0766_2-20121228/37117_1 /TAXON_ID=439317 /ORGANISM="Gambierdiscus australes, Strain CAWD 149" /LENGTH=388 /DNA_ID=CAMNT_0011551033 /DNA_START=138 /DNA_END=1304 /DNA_ORIENTATION=-